MRELAEEFPSAPGAEAAARSEVEDAIRSAAEIPEELKPLLLEHAAAFVDRELVRSAPGARHQMGQIGYTRWVIRNDQLDLLKHISTAAAAVVAYVAVAAASPYVLATALVFAVLALGRRLREKGVVLDADQYRLLLTL